MKPGQLLALAFVGFMMCTESCKKPSTGLYKAMPTDGGVPVCQNYYAIFNKTTNTTRVFGDFTLGDANGPFASSVSDSEVTVNGEKGDLFEGWDLVGLADVNIVFKRKDSTFHNSISMSDIDDINFSANTPTEISHTATTSFPWDGPPLGTNETAEILFTPPGTPNGSSGFSIGLADNNVLLLPRSFESTLARGTYKMVLRRRKVLPLDQQDNNAGGTMVVKIEVERNVVIK